MADPKRWSLAELRGATLGAYPVAWVTPSVRARVLEAVPALIPVAAGELPDAATALLAAGGGSLIDRAKHARALRRPELRLVALPSIWGSGAERSAVTVLDDAGAKHVFREPSWVPDVVVSWPDLAASVPLERARHGCADAWAHALEALLSPIASPTVQSEAVALVRRMLRLPLRYDPAWFEVSVEAVSLLGRAGAGLVHGLAHALEAPARIAAPDGRYGHARLCAACLWPTLRFNLGSSPAARARVRDLALDPGDLERAARSVFDPEAWHLVRALLPTHQASVLRDPSTRMNCARVGAGALEALARFEGEVTDA
jgi:alcohol dehydrogenase class IV